MRTFVPGAAGFVSERAREAVSSQDKPAQGQQPSVTLLGMQFTNAGCYGYGHLRVPWAVAVLEVEVAGCLWQ